MLTLVRRRARAQWRLLVGVLVLVTLGTTLLGIGALLLGVTQGRAFGEGIQDVARSRPQDVQVTAFVVDVGPDVEATREAAAAAVRELLAPVGSTSSTTTVARLRRLEGQGAGQDPGQETLAYLESDDAFLRRAVLTSGRLPTGPGETVVPDAAAAALGLAVGGRLTLGAELTRTLGEDTEDRPVALEVVGTYRPRARAGWESDPLSALGSVTDFSDGSVTAPAVGPLVVDDETLLASGSTVDAVQVVGRPDLGGAGHPAVAAAAAAVADGTSLLTARVGDGARLTRLASELPGTVQRIDAQQGATRSTVLVVLLLATASSAVALLLAGRLVQASREDERALLASLGAERRQLVLAAAGEALVVAAASTVLAVPAASLLQAWLSHATALGAAGLAQGPTVTGALVLTVALGAVALALGLVVPALAREPEGGAAGATGAPAWRGSVVTRLGADAVLLGVAAAAWWSVRTAAPAPGAGTDVVAVLAPVVGLTAASLVVARAVPGLLAGVSRTTARSRSLLVPLALRQAARRRQASAALLLVVLTATAATFAVSVRATWERSQDDQAALRVGTDLSLALSGPAGAADAAAVATATGGTASAVVARPLALGRYLGSAGDPPVLVAVDQRRAGTLLRGRLGGGATWSEVGAELAPTAAVSGVPLPADGAGTTLSGTAPDGVLLSATPRMVLQDSAGSRTAVAAAAVRLDGREHRMRWATPVGAGQSLVALRLVLSLEDQAPSADGGGAGVGARVSVALGVPALAGADAAPAPSWQVTALGPPGSEGGPASGVEVQVTPSSQGTTVVTTTASLDLAYLQYDDAELLDTAFEVPDAVPVAVSQRLADDVGTRVGGTLAATVAEVSVPLEVVAVVPDVPSAPGRVAVLADADLLSRALVGGGRLEPVLDGWWVGDPPAGTAAALRGLDLGEVVSRRGTATALARGPLQVLVPTGLLVLGAAASVLLLAGATLVLTSDQRRRALEVARLRALGLPRSRARLLVLAEHAAVLVPLVLLGALLGAAASAVLGPALVRSDVGGRPVPRALATWPWGQELALAGGLLLGCVLAAAAVAWLQVRLSDTARIGADA